VEDVEVRGAKCITCECRPMDLQTWEFFYPHSALFEKWPSVGKCFDRRENKTKENKQE